MYRDCVLGGLSKRRRYGFGGCIGCIASSWIAYATYSCPRHSPVQIHDLCVCVWRGGAHGDDDVHNDGHKIMDFGVWAKLKKWMCGG